ncbi:MAG: hypothetical protein A4E53_02539 [Pelotomaculum sp. PtaB.Bin104]|nr:MAG: hypothetical protein A4E53_02539 [Pelotomaculum sp. PtaB.Bin104]
MLSEKLKRCNDKSEIVMQSTDAEEFVVVKNLL